VHAQQNKLKPLIQQIAASKVYLSYVKTGYKVVSGGLRVISQIKDSDLTLHLNNFDALKLVNPKIKGLAHIAAIIALQQKIIQLQRSSKMFVQNSGDFTSSEISYVQTVWQRLLTDNETSMDALMAIVTSGELSMTDDQRMERIAQIYQDLQEQTKFAVSFQQQLHLLSTQRSNEKVELNLQRKLHNQ
jgi:hypothetical protein